MGTKILQAYGVGGPTIPVFPVPIQAERAPASTDTQYPQGQRCFDNSLSGAHAEYTYDGFGTWNQGGNAFATTTTPGIVTLTDNSMPVATKVYADALVAAGAPVATETQAGIGELATDGTTELVQKLQASKKTLSLPAALEKLDKYDCIILDDFIPPLFSVQRLGSTS